MTEDDEEVVEGVEVVEVDTSGGGTYRGPEDLDGG